MADTAREVQPVRFLDDRPGHQNYAFAHQRNDLASPATVTHGFEVGDPDEDVIVPDPKELDPVSLNGDPTFTSESDNDDLAPPVRPPR